MKKPTCLYLYQLLKRRLNEVKQNPSAGAETDSNSTDVENNSINGTEGNYEEKGDKAF